MIRRNYADDRINYFKADTAAGILDKVISRYFLRDERNI
jgi:hypothetical protein